MVASIILIKVTLAQDDFNAYFGGVKYEYRAEGMDIIV
jgi:hypothetical protein